MVIRSELPTVFGIQCSGYDQFGNPDGDRIQYETSTDAFLPFKIRSKQEKEDARALPEGLNGVTVHLSILSDSGSVISWISLAENS